MELKNYFAQDKAGNVIPYANVALYYKATDNLAEGITDAEGNLKANPFKADINGLIQFAAPDGDYDLKVYSGVIENRISIKLLDLTAAKEAAKKSEGLASYYADKAKSSAADAVSVVTNGTASLTPSAGKIPIAGSDGALSAEWIKHKGKGLAEKIEQLNFSAYEGGSLIKRLRDQTTASDQYVKINDTGNLLVGCTVNNSKAVEFTMVNNPDNLLLMRQAYAGDLKATYEYVHITRKLGAFIAQENNRNGYTKEVGAKFEIDFIGTEIWINHNTDDRGGVWEVKIDDLEPVTFSTWNSSSLSISTIIASKLSSGSHTLVATFMGSDPDNPPSDGVARGWVNWDITETNIDNDFYAAAKVQKNKAKKLDDDGRIPLMSSGSIPEFAIASKAVGSAFSSGHWTPNHGNKGASVTISRKVILDGKDYGDDFTVLGTDLISAKIVAIVQSYVAYNSDDKFLTEPLWNGELVHRFENGEVSVSHTLEYLRDLIGTGYLGMFPVNSSKLQKLILSSGEEITLVKPAAGTIDTSVKFSRSAAFIGIDDSVAIGYEASSLGDILGMREEEMEESEQFFQQRVDGIAKIYWRKYNSNRVIPAGHKDRYTSTYKLAAALPNVKSI